MALVLPELPYDTKALEPFIGASTLTLHHDKHHATYVNNYNNLTKDTPLAKLPLEEVIRKTAGDPAKSGIFNNGAQAWNHTFFWNCLRPAGNGKPTVDLRAKMEADLGGFDKFVEAFETAAAAQFGSGWVWLVLDQGKLSVTKTANADTPIAHGQIPLFTVDLWEHAYYLDYQNRRPDFVSTVLDNIANWDFVARNLAAAPRHSRAA